MPDSKSRLVHHYTFAGTGTTAYDSAGDADGDIVGASLRGTGYLTLPGGLGGPHVKLPPGIISSLESVTVEAWLTWAGGSGYQRIFDFGNSSAGAGKQGAGTRHFSVALAADDDTLRLVFDADPTTGSAGWRAIFSGPAMSTNAEHQVAAVFDRGANEIRLYVDSVRRGSAAVPATEGLSSIDDVNNWLGMAQWAPDPNFAGTLSELRIYDVPLSDFDIRARFQSRY